MVQGASIQLMKSLSLMDLAKQFVDGTAPKPFSLNCSPFIPDAKNIRSLKEVLPEFRERMQKEYPSKNDYKYHNWDGHILSLEAKAIEIIKRCNQVGIKVNKELVLAIIYSHDAKFHINPESFNTKHKEQVAGHFAYSIAKELGCSEVDARQIEDGVFSTHSLGELDTTEKKIARAADLHNVGGAKLEFLAAFRNLYLEHVAESRSLGLNPKPLQKWRIDAFNFLGNFLLPIIELTPNAKEPAGRSKFHMHALENIIFVNDRLCRNHDAKSHQRVIAQIGGLGSADELTNIIQPNDLVITCTTLDSLREQLTSNKESLRSSPNNIFLPTHYLSNQMSIPDNSCDVAILEITDVKDFAEISRITKQGGLIIACMNPITASLNDLANDSFKIAAKKAGLVIKHGDFDFAKPTELAKAVA